MRIKREFAGWYTVSHETNGATGKIERLDEEYPPHLQGMWRVDTASKWNHGNPDQVADDYLTYKEAKLVAEIMLESYS